MSERAYNSPDSDWSQAADDMGGRFDDEPRQQKERPAVGRFPLIAFDQIRLSTSPRFRVRGLLPIRGLAVVWGPPKCGKSFLAFDMLMHVALGWPYQGHRVEPGTIVYCALEGQQGFEARKVAFEQAHLDSFEGEVPFYLMPASLALVADAAELITAIRAQLPDGKPPAVVCLDTLNRSFTGSESDDRDMTAYVRAADSIRDAFGCLVVIVHHCGLEGTRPRGHSALAGAVDAQLAVKKLGDGFLSCTVELMKDGPDGETVTCRLELVEVGIDDAGEPITSCVVEAVTDSLPDLRPGKQASKRLSERNRLALEALREAVMTKGAQAPHGLALPANIRVVPPDAWKDELFRRGILDRDASGYREQFRRMKLDLMAREAVAERDGNLWIVP
ncbi:AAA family ATPase [Methylobacterium sp. J-077]|uniref:AAA family ATPase n=1 Tax=Methylobacterium sp. J-077 TaxID=2836656 RepID=UPI001FB879CE|nr:AAA family ATPase [Methylobacterium sp. J-077]MCJ2126672.1 helicase RepA family protein [Methylobacterium sp. J-077]